MSDLRVDGCGDAGRPSKRDPESSSSAPPLAARLVEPPPEPGSLRCQIRWLRTIAREVDLERASAVSEQLYTIAANLEALQAGRLVDPLRELLADLREALKEPPTQRITGICPTCETDFANEYRLDRALLSGITRRLGRLVDPSPPDIERELRMEWWLNHGLKCMPYGDDGEMQCCGLDFKRMPLDELRPRVNEFRLKRISDSIARVDPSPLEDKLSENTDDQSRVAPSVPCVAPIGSTADQGQGEQSSPAPEHTPCSFCDLSIYETWPTVTRECPDGRSVTICQACAIELAETLSPTATNGGNGVIR